MRARLFWTDGHNDVRDINPSSDDVDVPGDDGLGHFFSRSVDVDGEGLQVWVEARREWERFHRNGRRSAVFQYADVNPGRYSAGSPERGMLTGFDVNIPTLDEAKRVADRASTCPQPCDCPPWKELA